MKQRFLILLALIAVIVFTGVVIYRTKKTATGQPRKTLRIGYFSNMTHAQALVGMARGTFQEHAGHDISLDTKLFNAGPAEIEALYAGAIDIGYIGPGPAINGYMKSGGQEVRIISGSAAGGASLVVRPDVAARFTTAGPAALRGTKIASPQQGNTQDLSLRHYLSVNRLSSDVTITPVPNSDQMTLFAQRSIDGAWAPEPWASLLVAQAGGVRIIDERELWDTGSFASAVVITRVSFLRERPELVRAFLAAHRETTDWITAHPDEAKNIVANELERLTHKSVPAPVLGDAWNRLTFTVDPVASSVGTFVSWAKEQLFISGETASIGGLFSLHFLNDITGQKYQ